MVEWSLMVKTSDLHWLRSRQDVDKCQRLVDFGCLLCQRLVNVIVNVRNVGKMLHTVRIIRSWTENHANVDNVDTFSGFKKKCMLQSEIIRYIFIYFSTFLSSLSTLSTLSTFRHKTGPMGVF